MRKGFKIFISALSAALIAIPVFCAACEGPESKEPEFVDYVSELKLDLTSETKKQEVDVRLYIDGDTTHFDPKSSTITGYDPSDFEKTQGYIKARYLAINTPESTGKIEPWGKKASDFTHNKLATAQSIIVESDDGSWNVDSTGERYMLWVWYKPEGATDYRNLNVEILQEGLAIGSNTAGNRYGTIASNALSQAKAKKLFVFSDEDDPDFFYGTAIPVTLKELRCHVTDYANKKVKVTGVVTTEFSNSVYIEEFDPDTGVYFGFAVYYGFTSGKILEVLTVGNEVSVVGTVSEFQGTYQISGVSYNGFDPNDPLNSNVISTDKSAAFVETDARDIVSGKLAVRFEEGEEEETVNINYGEAIMSTTVTLSNMTVTKIYTTSNGGQSDGAMSITCKAADGTTITVRTEVLKDENGQLVTADRYLNKTITVKGLIEKFNGEYQVKCYRADYITVVA